MQTLGLIGFGQFGQLAADHLRYQFDILVTDAAEGAAQTAADHKVKFGTLEEAAGRDIVVIAVPVQAMRGVLTAIAPLVKRGATVIDVGSVKVLPTQWMQEILPDYVDIVPTHPLFGPQSAKRGLTGLRFVVCPVKGDRHLCVAQVARSLGLTVAIASPEEHDREMAYVQALSHLVGRSMNNLGVLNGELKTKSYQHLLDMCGLLKHDTFELFTAIQTLNPYAAEVAGSFVDEAAGLLARVKSGT